MPAQSETTKPVNPSSPLRSPVMSFFCACILVPFQLENETITVRTPSFTAC